MGEPVGFLAIADDGRIAFVTCDGVAVTERAIEERDLRILLNDLPRASLTVDIGGEGDN